MGRELAGLGTWALLLGLVLTSSVVAAVLTKLLERSGAHLERLRDGYAEAAKALVAWNQFPYRIERRVDDEPATRSALADAGSEITERLAYYSSWISSDSRVLGDFYLALVARLQADVAEHARHAWRQPPRRTAAEMNLRQDDNHRYAPEGPAGWSHARAFADGSRYRFGWRRYVVSQRGLRRRLDRQGLWPSGRPAPVRRD